MEKGGITQVDWAISLGLFLMFVVWFFIIVRPQFLEDELQTSLADVLEDNFKTDYRWTINKLPLIVKTNITNDYEPIIADFPFSWEKNHTNLDNNTEFVLDNGKIIFIEALNQTTRLFWFINSDDNYTQKSFLKSLNANATVATTGQNLKISFKDSLYNEISYNNKVRLNNTVIWVEDEPIEIDSNSSSFYDTVAIYNIETEAINHTSYIFPKNSVIYNYMNLNKNESYTLTIFADLHDYTKYYASNLYYGNISYDNPSCTAFSSDRITLYDINSVTFNFNSFANIKFCYDNETIKFNATFTLENETYYKIYFHEGNFSNITLKRYEADFGAIEKEKGLNFDKIKSINYQSLKDTWNVPESRDFRIVIWNTTSVYLVNRTELSIFEVGASNKGTEDVAVKEWDDHILTGDGQLHNAVVNIKTW